MNFVFHVPQNRQAVSEPVGSEEGIVLRRNDEGVRRRKRMSVPENAWSAARRRPGRVSACHARWNVSRKIAVSHRYSCRLVLFGTYTRGYRRNTWKNSAPKTILHDFDPKPAGVNPDCQGRSSDSFPPQRLPSDIASGKECAKLPGRGLKLTAAGTVADFHGIPY